jgi:hypothetical protein
MLTGIPKVTVLMQTPDEGREEGTFRCLEVAVHRTGTCGRTDNPFLENLGSSQMPHIPQNYQEIQQKAYQAQIL